MWFARPWLKQGSWHAAHRALALPFTQLVQTRCGHRSVASPDWMASRVCRVVGSSGVWKLSIKQVIGQLLLLNSFHESTCAKANTLWVLECLSLRPRRRLHILGPFHWLLQATGLSPTCARTTTAQAVTICANVYGCLTHNCQASCKLLNFSVQTWSSLSLFWICFDSSSFLLNHSALTVASSFFSSPFTLHPTALFGSLSFAVQGADYSFVVIGASWVGAVVLQEIVTRGVGLASSISGVWVCQQLWLLCQALPRIRLTWTDVVYEKVRHHKNITKCGTSQALDEGSLEVAMTTVRWQPTVSASNCCGKGNVISDKAQLQFCQSQARREVASKKPTSVANAECFGEVVGSSWCCCFGCAYLLFRLCLPHCLAMWCASSGSQGECVCVCVVSVCACVFTRVWVLCLRSRRVGTCSLQTQEDSVRRRSLIFPWWSEIIEGHCGSSRQSLAASCAMETRESCETRDLSPNI